MGKVYGASRRIFFFFHSRKKKEKEKQRLEPPTPRNQTKATKNPILTISEPRQSTYSSAYCPASTPEITTQSCLDKKGPLRVGFCLSLSFSVNQWRFGLGVYLSPRNNKGVLKGVWGERGNSPKATTVRLFHPQSLVPAFAPASKKLVKETPKEGHTCRVP